MAIDDDMDYDRPDRAQTSMTTLSKLATADCGSKLHANIPAITAETCHLCLCAHAPDHNPLRAPNAHSASARNQLPVQKNITHRVCTTEKDLQLSMVFFAVLNRDLLHL